MIRLATNAPSALLGTPEGLQIIGNGRELEIITDNQSGNRPRQIKAPEGLVDIQVASNTAYRLRFFTAADVEPDLDTNGYYAIKIGSVPFVSYLVENPSGDTNACDALNVVREYGGQAITNSYTFSGTSGSNAWTLSRGNGMRLAMEENFWAGPERARWVTVRDSAGTVASKVKHLYRTVTNETDQTEKELDLGEIVDPDGAALATERTYYENGCPTGSFGLVAAEVRADGGWSRYEYDAQGRRTLGASSWLDAGTNATMDGARVVSNDYASVDAGVDDLSLFSTSPRTVTEKIGTSVVARTFHVYGMDNSGGRVEMEERAASPAAAYGAAGNLGTTRVYYPDEALNPSPQSGKIKTVEYPDGRMDSYTYELGLYVASVPPADNSFEANATGDWVRVTLTHGTTDHPEGVEHKTTREVTIQDLLGYAAEQETQVFTGDTNDYPRIGWTVTYRDERHRVTDEHRSDGTHLQNGWACCGKEWDVEGTGIEHGYAYDELQRLTGSTKEGVTNGPYAPQAAIATQYVLDAEGRRLLEIVSAGALTLVTSNRYDLAGRLVETVDPAGLVTGYAYTNGGRTQTVTLPGGATRVTDRYLDGRTKSETGTAGPARYYEYGVNADGTQFALTRTASTNSPMWARTTTDFLGRTLREERPGFGGATLTNSYAYDGVGRLAESVPPAGAVTRYLYDEIGNQTRSGLDVDGVEGLQTGGTDRITDQESRYENTEGAWWRVSSACVYAQTNGNATTTSVQRVRLTGLGAGTPVLAAESVSADARGNQTANRTYVDAAAKEVTQVVDYPDSTNDAETVSVNGLVQAQAGKSGHLFAYGHDALGRQTGLVDPRTGTNTTHYNGQGWVDYVEDAAGNRTSYGYDGATGRRTSQTDALSNLTCFAYDLQGRLTNTWGATYPVAYRYDDYGRMTEMLTKRGVGDPGDSTRWFYEEGTGLLTNKAYADGKGVGYSYTADGKLATRTWARGISTAYAYDPATGELTNINYAGSAPAVTFSYDRLGRQTTAQSSARSHAFAYGAELQLESETITGDGASNVIARAYDGQGRSAGFSMGSAYGVAYGYDGAGRFNSLTGSAPMAVNVSYAYLADSDLIEQRAVTQGATTTWGYEPHRSLITRVGNQVGTNLVSQYDYVNDAVGRRTSIRTGGTAFEPAGAMFNLYQYTGRSEVTGAGRYFGTNVNDTAAPVAGQAYAYQYDEIGNRTQSAEGATNRTSTYTANDLNQYTGRTVPGEFDVLGTAATNATVTVNNQATSRHGAYYHKALAVDNAGAAAYPLVSVVGVRTNAATNGWDIVTTVSGHVFVARSPEGFTYDDDGNMLSDGRWTYSWDGENRLVGMQTAAGLTGAVPRLRLDFGYDYMGRRVKKEVWLLSGTNWVGFQTNTFIYDGWNLVREVGSQGSGAVTNWYVWGLDLSGSLQGAGGIGGLLAVAQGTNAYAATFDANGNVSEYLGADGGVAAHYEYGPFGNTVVATGPAAEANPHRFSTKYTDDETGLLYYGSRFYSASLGRWISRDPLTEHAFWLLTSPDNDVFHDLTVAPLAREDFQVYSFVQNGPISRTDPHGLQTDGACCAHPCGITDFKLSEHVGPLAGAWAMIDADWGESGSCNDVKTFWWTCTYQGDVNEQDYGRGRRNVKPYLHIAWFPEGSDVKTKYHDRSQDMLAHWYFMYANPGPVIVYAKLETVDECGKHRTWYAQKACICVTGNTPLCNCGAAPPEIK